MKLIHRIDLPKLIGHDGNTEAKPWDRVWVVVVQGEVIPVTMTGGPRPTYTVEVIPHRYPPVVEAYVSDGPGDRPAAWESVIGLAGT